MKEVASGIFVESSYPPYNVVLIRSERGGVVVDVPPSPAHCSDWLAQALEIAGTLRYVVMTDGSLLHQLGTVACHIPIIAAEPTLRLMQAYDEDRPRHEFLDELVARYPEEAEVDEDLAPPKPMLAIDCAMTLYLGDRKLLLEAVDGAGPGSLWIWLEDEALLIPGDTVVADAVPPMANVPDSKAWLNTMKGLAHRSAVETIIPGRGKAAIDRGEIEAQREFMRVMRRAARSLARRRSQVEESLSSLDLTRTAQELGQTFYSRFGRPAVKEIRAGLERLVEELQQTEDATEEVRNG